MRKIHRTQSPSAGMGWTDEQLDALTTSVDDASKSVQDVLHTWNLAWEASDCRSSRPGTRLCLPLNPSPENNRIKLQLEKPYLEKQNVFAKHHSGLIRDHKVINAEVSSNC